MATNQFESAQILMSYKGIARDKNDATLKHSAALLYGRYAKLKPIWKRLAEIITQMNVSEMDPF